MRIYSKTTALFLKRAKLLLKDILSSEMGLKVFKSRFQWKKHLYPINLVVFERGSTLGFFEPHSYQIGLSKRLLLGTKESLIKDILRHEMAHFWTYLEKGNIDHGPDFREACRHFGWSETVSKATIDLVKENEKKEGDLKAEKLVSKIQKLLSLAGSSNPHESEAATLKANELMINYNLERLHSTNSNSHENEETAYVKRVLHGKKNSAKYHAIYDILLLFMVKPVFNYGKDGFYLEVIGEKSNVLIAEYIGAYLDNELERLWKKQKELTPHLKGLSMKNSFMRGVAKGYKEKMELSKRKLLKDDKSLILLEGSLQTKVDLVYPRLSHTTSQRGAGCQESEYQGKTSGKGLFIPRALKSGTKNQKQNLILNSP